MSWKAAMLVRQGRVKALEEVDRLAGMHCAPAPLRLAISQLLIEAIDAPVPDSGPETSKAAAKNMRVNVGSLRHRALEAYAKEPLTDEECGDRIGHDRIWPRCSELRALGLIEPNGETRLIERTGQQGEVCAITDAGKLALTTTEEP